MAGRTETKTSDFLTLPEDSPTPDQCGGTDNPHGYALDQRGCPVCHHCKVATHPHYRSVPGMACWSCGWLIKADSSTAPDDAATIADLRAENCRLVAELRNVKDLVGHALLKYNE